MNCFGADFLNFFIFVLQENLAVALREFKREKINRQNARLSLANSVYDNPTMPRRKIMLSVGGTNYRPPLERSKSAPKLMAIEEAIAEEEEEETEQDTFKRQELQDMKSCCKEYSLFPATTLGRRRCRRGHSIRRTRLRNSLSRRHKSHDALETALQHTSIIEETPESIKSEMSKSLEAQIDHLPESKSSEEDFEQFLEKQNYETSDLLSGEFLAYLNQKLNQSTNSLHNIGESESKASTLKETLSLDNLDEYEYHHDDIDIDRHHKFFNQSDILDILTKKSLYDESNSNSYSSSMFDDDNDAPENHVEQISDLLINTHIDGDNSEPPSIVCLAKCVASLDSDEGSISSGCETSSTVTTMADEQQKPCSVLDRVRSFEKLAIQKPLGERRRHNSASSTPPSNEGTPKLFQRSITIPAPGIKPNYALPTHHTHHRHRNMNINHPTTISNNNLACNLESIDSDSELSDESGYVEFQENNTSKKNALIV